jgi:hypothetical protein
MLTQIISYIPASILHLNYKWAAGNWVALSGTLFTTGYEPRLGYNWTLNSLVVTSLVTSIAYIIEIMN